MQIFGVENLLKVVYTNDLEKTNEMLSPRTTLLRRQFCILWSTYSDNKTKLLLQTNHLFKNFDVQLTKGFNIGKDLKTPIDDVDEQRICLNCYFSCYHFSENKRKKTVLNDPSNF